MKRYFSILLALLLAFSCMTALGEESPEAEPEFEIIVTEPDEEITEEVSEEMPDSEEIVGENIPVEEILADDSLAGDSSGPDGTENGSSLSEDSTDADDNSSDDGGSAEEDSMNDNSVDNGSISDGSISDGSVNDDSEKEELPAEDTKTDEDKTEEQAPQKETSDEQTEGDMALLAIFQEEPAILSDIIIDTYAATAEIVLSGSGLEGTTACVKIVPVGDEKNIAYIRQLAVDNYGGCIFSADLSGINSQLFKITADCGRAGRIEKLFTCGEAEKLICKRNLLSIGVSGTADVKTEQNINIKITDTNGNIKYARQVKSSADGSYSINAAFDGIDSNAEYIVSVTEEKTGRQFVKKTGILTPESAVYEKSCMVSGTEGRGEVVIFGKNLADTSKYLYEVTYNPSAMRVKYDNLIGSNIKILSTGEGRIVFSSENRNDAGKLWSGTINALQFELLSGSGNVTLRVYEKGTENAN